MGPEKFEISLKLLNKIGDYLGKRPYVEVVVLLNEMAALKPIFDANHEQPNQAEEIKDAT